MSLIYCMYYESCAILKTDLHVKLYNCTKYQWRPHHYKTNRSCDSFSTTYNPIHSTINVHNCTFDSLLQLLSIPPKTPFL